VDPPLRGRSRHCHSFFVILVMSNNGNERPTTLTLHDIHNGNSVLLMAPHPPPPIKTTPIGDDYDISGVTLGVGINGKVVECTRKATGGKFALKVLRDNVKARREVELHWRASGCKHIVSVVDLYSNAYKGSPCLLVVMEWYVKVLHFIYF